MWPSFAVKCTLCLLFLSLLPIFSIAAPRFLPPNVLDGGYLTATDFGADARGDTDSQTALQTALTQAKNQKKALYLPSGFYNHSHILIVDSVVVFGDGDSTIIFANSTDNSALQLIGNNSALYYMWVSGNPHLRDNGLPYWNLVWGFHARNITLRNIRVAPLNGVGEARPTFDHLGVWGVGGIFLYGVQEGIVTDNIVDWTVADSIHITACAKNILVQRNIIGHSGDDAIAMVTYGVGPNTCFVQNIEIAENYAYNGIYSRGITCIGCKNALIRDNTVVNSTNAALWLSSEVSYNTSCWHNVRVIRNTLLRTGYVFNSTSCSDSTLPASGIDRGNVLDTCEDVYFADNTIRDTCRQGFRVSGYGSAGFSGGLIFVGNTIEHAKAAGIWVPGNRFNSLIFAGNTVRHVGSEGFIVSGNNVSTYIENMLVADHAQNQKKSAFAFYAAPDDLQVSYSNHTMESGKAYIWSLQMQYSAHKLRVSNNSFPTNFGQYNGTGVARVLGPASGVFVQLPLVDPVISINLDGSRFAFGTSLPVSILNSKARDDSYVIAAFGAASGANVTLSEDRETILVRTQPRLIAGFKFSALFYKPGGGVATCVVTAQLLYPPTYSPVSNEPVESVTAPTSGAVHPKSAQPAFTSMASKALLPCFLIIGSFSLIFLST